MLSLNPNIFVYGLLELLGIENQVVLNDKSRLEYLFVVPQNYFVLWLLKVEGKQVLEGLDIVKLLTFSFVFSLQVEEGRKRKSIGPFAGSSYLNKRVYLGVETILEAIRDFLFPVYFEGDFLFCFTGWVSFLEVLGSLVPFDKTFFHAVNYAFKVNC